ncbi:MAG: HAD-IA family hydrolase [Acidobacteria bacterium]|nr:HAD-IA family hydrolase [Acidobacteriota bacterium]
MIELFDAVITGEDVRRRKPDPEGLLACASMLGVSAADAAYVGDTPLDIEAAHAAGMIAMAVLGGAGDSALLSAAGADRLVASLGRLPGVVTIGRAT